jgi:hypothetical protein
VSLSGGVTGPVSVRGARELSLNQLGEYERVVVRRGGERRVLDFWVGPEPACGTSPAASLGTEYDKATDESTNTYCRDKGAFVSIEPARLECLAGGTSVGVGETVAGKCGVRENALAAAGVVLFGAGIAEVGDETLLLADDEVLRVAVLGIGHDGVRRDPGRERVLRNQRQRPVVLGDTTGRGFNRGNHAVGNVVTHFDEDDKAGGVF